MREIAGKLLGWAISALLITALVDWLGTASAALTLSLLGAFVVNAQSRSVTHMNEKINALRDQVEKQGESAWKMGDRLQTRIERLEDRR